METHAKPRRKAEQTPLANQLNSHVTMLQLKVVKAIADAVLQEDGGRSVVFGP